VEGSEEHEVARGGVGGGAGEVEFDEDVVTLGAD